MSEVDTVRIHGTFLGQPIDVTVSECDQPDQPAPDDDTASEVKSDIEPPAAVLDTSAEGEVTPGEGEAPQDTGEVPPNPEGNAEQLG